MTPKAFRPLLAQATNQFPDWSWFNETNRGRLVDYTIEHVELTVYAVAIGLLIALPLAVLAVRRRSLYTPLLNVAGVLFTIPSAALFILILSFAPFGGLNNTTALTGLVIYTLLILFRNTVAGLDGVGRDVREAAEAMGYSDRRRMLRVELPLALPVVMAGVRIAAVTTIGLVTITAFIGKGGLGQLFILGFSRRDTTEVMVGVVACILLAVLADLALLATERRLTPWSQARSR